MDIKKIFRQVSINLAVSFNMEDTVTKIAAKDPSLVNDNLISYAVYSGQEKSLNALLKVKPLNASNSDSIISMLENPAFAKAEMGDYDTVQDIREEEYRNYKKVVSVLLEHNLIQKEGQFSRVLKIHNNFTKDNSIGNNLLDEIVNKGDYKISSEEIKKAVVDNIGNMHRRSIAWLNSNNHLPDEGQIYTATLAGTNKEVKVGLIGLAAISENVAALSELERLKYSVSVNDYIATKDIASHSNNLYLFNEHKIQSPNSFIGESGKHTQEIYKERFVSNFAQPEAQRYENNKESHIFTTTSELLPPDFADRHQYENFKVYSPEISKTMAQYSERALLSQEKRVSPEIKSEAEKFIFDRKLANNKNNYGSQPLPISDDTSISLPDARLNSQNKLNDKKIGAAFKHH